MPNQLKTTFIFDDAHGAKVDSLNKKLTQTNESINNLKTDKAAQAFTNLANIGQNSLNRLKNSVNEIDRAFAGPQLAFADKYKAAFGDIESRAQKLTGSFQKLAQTKADKGQFDVISQGAIGAEQKVIALTRKIREIKKESADPANAQFGKYYAAGLREAETELAKFERKLSNLRRQNNSGGNFGGGGNGGNFGSGFSGSFGRRALGSNLLNGFNAEDVGSNAFGGALLGGAAGALVVAGFAAAKNAASALTAEVKDLTIESIKLAANFEESTNSLAIFAGGTYNARNELSKLDAVALKTPGLTLENAEAGYKRLRALNFEAAISRDLIRGLGIARTQSGADAGAVDRVITNLTQLTSGSGTAADVRQTIGAIPSLRGTFQRAFGTADFGDINKLAKSNPDEFIRKFTAELSKAKTAQVGLNIAIEQGANSLTLAGRQFGEPFLQPLTRDVLGLTKTLNDNENTIKRWGQNFADVYNGLSTLITENPAVLKFLAFQARNSLAVATYGISELVAPTLENVRKVGENRRKGEESLDPRGAEGFLGFNFQQKQEEDEKAEKAIKRRQELIDLQKQVDTSQIENNLSYSKAVASSRLKGIYLIQENTKLEIEALQKQIQVNKSAAADSIANLSSEDFDKGLGLNIALKNSQENARIQNQINVLQISSQQQIVEEIKNTKTAYREFFVSIKSQENPFVKVLDDIDTAGKRAQDRFGNLGKEFVKAAAEAERSGLLKQLNLLSYQSGARALTSEQGAFRTSRIRDNELGGFQRALETVDKKVEFAVKMFELGNKINESDFYAYQFNPNNPKTYEQSRFSFRELDRFGESAGGRRRGESQQDYERRRQESISSGIRVNDAFGEISKLKNLSLDGTGIFGQGIVADKILERLPSREDLLRLLSSPYAGVRDQAQSLLGDQSNALRTKRDLEAQKLQDFLYDQQTKGLNQKFASQQLDLLNKSGLNSLDRAKGTVDILSPLGNDISPQQRRELYENQLAVAKYERQQKDDAQKYLRNISDKLDRVISTNGLKIDGTVGLDDDSKQALTSGGEVVIRDQRANSTGSTGSHLTVADNYDQIVNNLREGFDNSLGGRSR